ncbi:ribosomal protein L40E [Bradyrhizobium sp. USDA 3311]
MAETLGAEKGERTEARLGYRSWLLHTLADRPGGQDRVEGAAGPAGTALDRAVQALSALGGVGKADGDCLRCLDVRPAGSWRGAARSGGLACQMGRQVPQAHRLGRGQHRGTLTYFRLPLGHRMHMKSTNMLERLNEEIRRRTYGANLPKAESCLRLVRALTLERHEAQGPSLSQHGSVEGAQEGGVTPGGLTMLRPTKGMHATLLRRCRSPALRFRASERRRLRGDGSAGP